MSEHFDVKKMLFLAGVLYSANNAGAQTQKGSDIDGEAAYNRSGYSVSMPDAATLGIGAFGNSGNGQLSGHVRVYNWNGAGWVQKGADMDGEAKADRLGFSVSMPDANTLATGAYLNDGAGSNAGHVRVYFWDGLAWIRKGGDIDGEAADDFSGSAVCMADPNTVAIGAPGNDGNRNNSGQVRVYNWNGINWVQKGADLDGENAEDGFGVSVSMPDANTLAVGADGNDANGADAGHVRVFSWNGNNWVQKGADIDGATAGNRAGSSLSMPDSNTMAIGLLSDLDQAKVRIYRWDGNAWVVKGNDIGTSGYTGGLSLSMPDANNLVIGAWASQGGFGLIFRWDGSAWVQKNTFHLKGESEADGFGQSVSMPDPQTVAIGADGNDGNGTDAGHVRVFTFETAGVIENEIGPALKVFPNPTHGETTIDLGASRKSVSVIVRNATGQVVLRQQYADAGMVQLNIPGEAGIYLVEVNADNKQALLKVVKK